MITKKDVLMGRDVEFPLTEELSNNLTTLVYKINALEAICPFKFKISSGYRPGRYNKAAGGASKSSHLSCEAVDLIDRNGAIKLWCVKNIAKLSEIGLYMEDPARTPTWCHLQTRKTKGNPFKV